jgi:hypothetical protein
LAFALVAASGLLVACTSLLLIAYAAPVNDDFNRAIEARPSWYGYVIQNTYFHVWAIGGTNGRALDATLEVFLLGWCASALAWKPRFGWPRR